MPGMFLPPGYVKQDIVELLESVKHSKAEIYFPPKYTPDPVGRQALFDDLRRAAQEGGDCLTLSGRGNGKMQSMYVRCQCAVLYRGNKIDKADGSIIARDDYRKTTYSNNRKNNRPGQPGRTGSHRTSTNRRSSTDDRCPFSLNIFLNETHGYFMRASGGCFYHQYHARRDFIRTPMSLLTTDDGQMLKDLSSARAKTGTAANLHYIRTGRIGTASVLSNDQIKHFVKTKYSLRNADEDATKPGEIDELYRFLEESGSHYISLLARGPPPPAPAEADPRTTESSTPTKMLFNETRIGHFTETVEVAIAAEEEGDMIKVVSDHRRVLKIDDSQEMMVGIAYAMPYEVSQFQLFNVCLHIDATADSNKEGRPLVTVSSKDSYGKMFLILRAFPPNEQSWAYKWLFQTVFPALLGTDVLKRIKIIVTDGDSQEISQVDDAVARFFPNAYRIRCSWHIIDRGWQKKVNVNLGGKSRRRRPPERIGTARKAAPPLTDQNKTARTIYRWMFSWAQPKYCESEEEYFVSKSLFMMFVASTQVREVLGEVAADAIIKFARESVIPHEERMAYYKRHDLFHLETHTNCGHEGTNNGMKNCSIRSITIASSSSPTVGNGSGSEQSETPIVLRSSSGSPTVSNGSSSKQSETTVVIRSRKSPTVSNGSSSEQSETPIVVCTIEIASSNNPTVSNGSSSKQSETTVVIRSRKSPTVSNGSSSEQSETPIVIAVTTIVIKISGGTIKAAIDDRATATANNRTTTADNRTTTANTGS
jgi:hypothetical protein